MAFDNHCHVCFPELIENTKRGFETHIEKLGLTGIGLLSCPRTSHTGQEVDVLENLKILYLKDRLSVPVYSYAGFVEHTQDPDAYVAFAKSMMAMGFDGFKALEQHPTNRKKVGKGLCDPSYDGFWSYLEEIKVPMVCHVGDPRKNFSMETADVYAKEHGRAYDETHLSLDELYEEMEQVFSKHPEARIILAHFYFKSDDYEDLVRLMETYPKICLDLTPGAEMFNGFTRDMKKWTEFFKTYYERIILGSDLYGIGYGPERHQLVLRYLKTEEPFVMNAKGDRVTPMHLPEEMVEAITEKNARRLLGGEPKKIDRKLVYEYCLETKERYETILDEIGKANLYTFLDYWK